MVDRPDGQDNADKGALTEILRVSAPFNGVSDALQHSISRGARIERHEPGDVVLDGFSGSNAEAFVVVAGSVDLWNTPRLGDAPADERIGPGGIFGFSTMLTRRSVGPLAVAVDQ